MKKIKLIAITGVVLTSLTILSGCGSTSEPKADKKPPVETTQEADDKTGSKDQAKEQAIDKVLYEKDGIKISTKGIFKDNFDTKLKLTIENNSDKAITIQSKDVSINGIMIDGILSSDIQSGKKANDTLNFFNNTLKENDITDVKDIELKFHIFNSDNLFDGFNTDTIKITF